MSQQRSLYSVLREAIASRDPLTGTLRRTAFERTVDSWVGGGAATRSPSSSLLFVSIDWSTQTGRAQHPGHRGTDASIRAVCDITSTCLRATDVLGRVEDETLGILLPSTPAEQAAHVARRVRAAVSERSPKFGIPVTVSVGVASAALSNPWDAAAEALEDAQLAGGNRIVVAQLPLPLRRVG